MNNIVLTSCGIRNEDFKNKFYEIIPKEELSNKKVLYITTAADGEPDHDKSWMVEEYQTMLDLGMSDNNIVEYKIGNDIDLDNFDIIYMMGGNTFYLLDEIRKYGFDKDIKDFINKNKVYIGSSAGSCIMGKSIEIALPFDSNVVNMTDFKGLNYFDGFVIPHCNQAPDFVEEISNSTSEKLLLLYDGDGLII